MSSNLVGVSWNLDYGSIVEWAIDNYPDFQLLIGHIDQAWTIGSKIVSSFPRLSSSATATDVSVASVCNEFVNDPRNLGLANKAAAAGLNLFVIVKLVIKYGPVIYDLIRQFELHKDTIPVSFTAPAANQALASPGTPDAG